MDTVAVDMGGMAVDMVGMGADMADMVGMAADTADMVGMVADTVVLLMKPKLKVGKLEKILNLVKYLLIITHIRHSCYIFQVGNTIMIKINKLISFLKLMTNYVF